MRFRSFCCPRRFAERNFALYLKLGWSSTELTTVSWLIVSDKPSITTAFFFSSVHFGFRLCLVQRFGPRRWQWIRNEFRLFRCSSRIVLLVAFASESDWSRQRIFPLNHLVVFDGNFHRGDTLGDLFEFLFNDLLDNVHFGTMLRFEFSRSVRSTPNVASGDESAFPIVRIRSTNCSSRIPST